MFDLSRLRYAWDFVRAVALLEGRGHRQVIVDPSRVGAVFPDACVAISALIQHYRSRGLDISLVNSPAILDAAGFDQPLAATSDELARVFNPLSKMWRFQDEGMVFRLVTAFVRTIAERVECQPGVLQALEWCLNEVMDNVFQHAQTPEGFAMIQIHPDSGRLAVCVADNGIGIYGSLGRSVHRPRTAVDAITLAVREGVTRDRTIGQGNGLWGLLQIVRSNSGQLSIKSGPGLLYVRGEESETRDHLPYPDRESQGTLVDFQIDVTRGIDISGALGGYRPVNLRLEELETDTGEHIVNVSQYSHGTGTRRAAEQIRNLVLNTLNEGASRVVVDLSGVAIVSSSFADEFIGKLVVRFGFYGFQRAISLINMNDAVQGIVHRAVAQRMSENL